VKIMKDIKINTGAKKTFGLLALTGAMVVPAFLSATQTAQADPPRHAPAWGRRGKDKDDRKERREDRKERRQDRREDRREDRRDRWDDRRDNDWRDNDRNDWRYRRPPYNGGYRPGTGGYRPGSGGYFPGGGGNSSVSFDGVVLNNSNTSDTFSVRGNDGRVYPVRYSRSSFRSGQRVRVVGYSQNGLIIATDINRL
jgi:hypothetical protein